MACGAFWERGVWEGGRFFIYIFISDIDAHLEFVSFPNPAPTPKKSLRLRLSAFSALKIPPPPARAVFLTQRRRGAECFIGLRPPGDVVNHEPPRTGFANARPFLICASVSAARPCWSVVGFAPCLPSTPHLPPKNLCVLCVLCVKNTTPPLSASLRLCVKTNPAP